LEDNYSRVISPSPSSSLSISPKNEWTNTKSSSSPINTNHQQVLTENQSSEQINEIIPEDDNKRRRMFICYLCGKELGSSSLPIHTNQCLQVYIYDIIRIQYNGLKGECSLRNNHFSYKLAYFF
jgi:hypothetical protein